MEPRPLPYDRKFVRVELQRRIPQLLAELGLAGRIAGGLCTPLNPTRRDRHRGSFVIWCAGAPAGGWKDYATGEKGDVFDLIGYVRAHRAWIDSYWWALEFLGLGRGQVRTVEEAEADRQRHERERKAAEARREADEAGKSADLFRWWLALPPIAGTIAETYLVEARGIELSRIPPPGALRFAKRLDHVDEATGEVTTWPAMVAAMTRGAKVRGLHRTWLSPDGSGKADVGKPKKMIGPVRGAAIRLSMGASAQRPDLAAKYGRRDPLAIGEGIETALSVAVARPDYRVWAAGSLSLIGGLEWPECASAAVLLRDNDWGPEPQAAFDRALEAWRRQARGRPVQAVASAVGKDFNDWRRSA